MSAVYAELPPVKVTISTADGKLAYEGRTNERGIFRTGNVPSGDYVVQFRSGKAAMETNEYLLVVAAGKRKVIADALRGEQFGGGGVAMRLKVGAGMKIEGQIVSERSVTVSGSATERVINGRIYRWVQDSTGTHIGPHWEEVGIGSSRNIVRIDRTDIQHIDDHFAEGSLVDRHDSSGNAAAAGYGH